jgi:hypothetical protein
VENKSLLLEHKISGKYNIFGENIGPLSAMLTQRKIFYYTDSKFVFRYTIKNI